MIFCEFIDFSRDKTKFSYIFIQRIKFKYDCRIGEKGGSDSNPHTQPAGWPVSLSQERLVCGFSGPSYCKKIII